ncbi:MAG: 4'-phosphopantetheinyl transferase superfamily protein, partial [Geminicoccaceae bacterium]
FLRTTPEKNFSNVFFRLWTLKEAIAKQTGQGFATEFCDINTLDLFVTEELNEIGCSTKAENLLFHNRLMIEDNALHLAISTAPASRNGEG